MAQPDHASSPPFPLPGELLVRVLQHLDLWQRLGACALVNHSWAAAAATATTDVIIVPPTSNTKLRSLTDRWLPKHGSLVSSISLHQYLCGGAQMKLNLPVLQLKQLVSLSLKAVDLEQGIDNAVSSSSTTPEASAACGPDAGDATQSNPLAPLTALTHLQLSSVNVVGNSIDTLCCLSALTRLQRLQLTSMSTYGATADQVGAALGGVLLQLVQLTHLQLRLFDISDTGIKAVSCLQQLKELRVLYCDYGSSDYNSNITSPSNIASASFAQLPPSLSLLEVASATNVVFDNATTPSFTQLTALQHLELDAVYGLEPVLLSNLVDLRHLLLEPIHFTSSAMAKLLGVLPRLEQLQHLELRFLGLYGLHGLHDESPEVQLEQCTALVASSHLTHLGLVNAVLPAGAVKRMFPAGGQLPALQKLWTSCRELLEPVNLPVGPGDVCSVVSCCPHLQLLGMHGTLQAGVQLTSLVNLTELTELRVSGDSISNEVASSLLVRLSTLQDLRITGATSFTDAGLLCLTQLTGLTRLDVDGCGFSAGLNLDGQLIGVLELTSWTSPPDVAQKLLKVCKASPACLRIMLEQREQQLKQREMQQEQLAAASEGAQQQVTSLERKVASLEQQLGDVRAQLQALQVQVAQLQ